MASSGSSLTGAATLSTATNQVEATRNAFHIIKSSAVSTDNNTFIYMTANIALDQGHTGKEVIVFQLFNDTTQEDIQTIQLDYELSTDASTTFTGYFMVLNASNINYHIKISVVDSYEFSTLGLDLAPSITIPITTFGQLDSNGDTEFAVEDIVNIINGSAAFKDMNHDGIFNSEDVGILLKYIKPINVDPSIQ